MKLADNECVNELTEKAKRFLKEHDMFYDTTCMRLLIVEWELHNKGMTMYKNPLK